MTHLSDNAIKEFTSELIGEDIRIKASTLRFLTKESSDKRLIPVIEQLLSDTRYVSISIPISYCEVRYAAAYALARAYKDFGIDKSIVLKGVGIPFSTVEGYEVRTYVPDEILKKSEKDQFELARDMGGIPKVDIEVHPGDHMILCLNEKGELYDNWKWSDETTG
jgi:hypothetical protein